MDRPDLDSVLELLKPVSWFPPMRAFGCEVASVGTLTDMRWPVLQAHRERPPGYNGTGIALHVPGILASAFARQS